MKHNLFSEYEPKCQLQIGQRRSYSIPLTPKGVSIHDLLAKTSPPAARPEGMNAISSLPVIQVDHLPHSPPPDRHDSQHRKPLRLQALHPHQQVSHPSNHEAHKRVQEPDRKPLGPQLHPRPLVEEHELVGIRSVGEEHGRVPDDPVHAPRHAEEVDEERPGHPDPAVVEQGLPLDDPLDHEGDGDEEEDAEQDDLVAGEERRAHYGPDLEARAGLYELGHGVGEAGEVGLVHLLGSAEAGVLGADEADVGQRVDAELVEGVLRLGELDVGEEEVAGAGVVGEEGGGEERELGAELGQVEVGLGVERGGVEEDEHGVGAARGGGGEEAGDGGVGEVDHAGRGPRAKGLELRHQVIGPCRGGGCGGEEQEREEQQQPAVRWRRHGGSSAGRRWDDGIDLGSGERRLTPTVKTACV